MNSCVTIINLQRNITVKSNTMPVNLPNYRVCSHNKVCFTDGLRRGLEKFRFSLHVHVLILSYSPPINHTSSQTRTNSIRQMRTQLLHFLLMTIVLQHAPHQVLVYKLRKHTANPRRIDADDLSRRVQFGGELFDIAAGRGAIPRRYPAGHVEQAGAAVSALFVGNGHLVPQEGAGDVHQLVGLLLVVGGLDHQAAVEGSRSSGRFARPTHGVGRQTSTEAHVVSSVDEVVDALAQHLVARVFYVGGYVLGYVFYFAVTADHEQETVQGLQKQRPKDLVGEDRRTRRGYLQHKQTAIVCWSGLWMKEQRCNRGLLT